MLHLILGNKQELDAAPPSTIKAKQFRTDRKLRTVDNTQREVLRTAQQDISIIKDQVKLEARKTDTKLKESVRKVSTEQAEIKTALKSSIAKVASKVDANIDDLAELKSGTSVEEAKLRRYIRTNQDNLSHIVEKRRRSDVAKSGNVYLWSDEQAIAISLAEWPEYVDIPVVLRYERTARFDFTAAADDFISVDDHGLVNGDKIIDCETDNTLPAGLAGSTVYYVMAVEAEKFKVTTDKPGTASPTPVDITDAGTGNHKITVATDKLIHSWYSDDAEFTIANTIVDLNIEYNGFAPELGDVRWRDIENQVPKFVDGLCNFRIYLPTGTYLATETITLTVKKTTAPLLANVVDLPIVITVTA